MPPDLALSSTLIGSNYPCLELMFMVPKVFEPLKFDCIDNSAVYANVSVMFFSRKLDMVFPRKMLKRMSHRQQSFLIPTAVLNHSPMLTYVCLYWRPFRAQ